MSFGVGISDIFNLIKLAKDTVQNCRCAPAQFAEASRVSQSLYLMLESIKNEHCNPESLLHKDDRTCIDFAIHFKNCESAMKPLATLVAKYKSLGSSDIRFIDRVRFPKKEYMELRGNLAYYAARLSDFLQMIGLGSLGRIEQKVENIKEHLPQLMDKLDQMCAEFRISGDKESVLSDHTDDEKVVWKTFRRNLNQAGFTSNVIREHEAAIFLRIRELTQCGLLDSDTPSSTWTDEALCEGTPIHRLPFALIDESETESEKTLTPKQSIGEINRNSFTRSLNMSFRKASEPIESDAEEDVLFNAFPQDHTSVHTKSDFEPAFLAATAEGMPVERIWRNLRGQLLLKGSFVRKEGNFVLLRDSNNEEVKTPVENLSAADLTYLNSCSQFLKQQPSINETPKSTTEPKFASESSNPTSGDSDNEEAIKAVENTHPEILVGKRTYPKIKWSFRKLGHELAPMWDSWLREELTCDDLPRAAQSGNLSRVKRLLKKGQHIECCGPISWTETVKEATSETAAVTKRHTYPETTALYRAAYAGWLDVVEFLALEGADVNTRNGYDGRISFPILFEVIKIGNERMARLLLEYGAKMEIFGPTTALHVASGQPKRSIVRLCLDYRANIEAKNREGFTPLYIAALGDFARNLELLLKEGAQCNVVTPTGLTALYKAAGRGREPIVELLLRYGADSNIGRGRMGETVMYKVAWYNELKIMDLLLDYGGDVNIQNKQKADSYKTIGEKVIHGVLAGLSQQHALMNGWGKSPLHAAAYQGHEEMLQLLLDAGAEIDASGNDGVTAVYVAAQQKHENVVRNLLKAGAQLETERHDPVLALINERNQGKSRKSKELIAKEEKSQQMKRMGTEDVLVGLVAQFAKQLSQSRRLRDQR